MKQLLLLVSFFATIGLPAQKTVHDANAETRQAKNFHAIAISDGIDLYLTQSNEEAVAVSASASEYRDRIRVEVVDGELKIYYDRQNLLSLNWGNRKLKAYVSIKNIDRLKASGGSDVYIDNELKADQLSMHLSGGSDFRGKLNSKNLTIAATGGSDVYLSGSAEKVVIHSSGGSDVHAYELASDYCTVESSGGSDVHITVNKEINGNASGGSDVYFKGTAINNSVKKTEESGFKKVR